MGRFAGLDVESLDPAFSVFLDPDEYAILESDAEGPFRRESGSRSRLRDGWLTVLTVFNGGPAEKAGLQPG